MNDDTFNDRRKALEEEFFRKEQEKQVTKLRALQEREQMRTVLRVSTGIESEATLDRIIALGLGPETVAAIGIVPLVAVAWANGKVEPAERAAILEAAFAAGLQKGGPGEALLEGWLREKPGDHLVETWVAYVQGLAERLTPEERAGLRHDIIGRARGVAEAAGGFLGLGNKVSADEAAVLSALERAFD